MNITTGKLYFALVLAIVGILLFILKAAGILQNELFDVVIAIFLISGVIVVVLILFQSYFQKVSEEQAQARSPI